METLDGTSWDVVISGTGIQQSLLALALSRSDKKILHVDRNDYYGGAEAALSLQDAEAWVKRVNSDANPLRTFSDAIIEEAAIPGSDHAAQLDFSRAYSLALAPQIIYSRSDLIRKLVSSKVYRQLEFLAVGSWFVYRSQKSADKPSSEPRPKDSDFLLKIPSSHEDISGELRLTLNDKRRLGKFLRFLRDHTEAEDDEWRDEASPLSGFTNFLERKFGIPPQLQDPFVALTLSPSAPSQLRTYDAMQRISRHLQSMGVFGRGFSSVIPKWGGISEIVQVGCRAAAVGGATYVLNKPVTSYETDGSSEQSSDADGPEAPIKVKLKDGEEVTTKWLIGCEEDLGDPTTIDPPAALGSAVYWVRSINIVASKLPSLFPSIAEGSPIPAGTLVYFPTKSDGSSSPPHGPVYLNIRSGETGECPDRQCIIYASVTATLDRPERRHFDDLQEVLESAVSSLLASVPESIEPTVIWRLKYVQRDFEPTSAVEATGPVLRLPNVAPALAFDDNILARVKDIWKTVMCEEVTDDEFMVFLDREAVEGAEEDEDT